MNIPVNPERRDPGYFRKKSEIGLGKVDNASVSEILANISEDIKIYGNQKNSNGNLETAADSLSSGLIKIEGSSAHASFSVGLFDSNDDKNLGNELASFCVDLTYYNNNKTVSAASISYNINVAKGNPELEESYLDFCIYEENLYVIFRDDSYNLKTYNRIGVNLNEWTSECTTLDNSENYSYLNVQANRNLSILLDGPKTSFSTDSADSLAIYTTEGNKLNLTKVSSTELETYDCPKINGVPFTANKDLEIDNVKGKGRDITIYAKHPGSTLNDAGTHDWEVLGNLKKANLNYNYTSKRFSQAKPSKIENSESDISYGLCRLSGYDLNQTTLQDFCNSFGNNNDVITVGLLKKLVDFLNNTTTISNYIFSTTNSGDEYIYVDEEGITDKEIEILSLKGNDDYGWRLQLRPTDVIVKDNNNIILDKDTNNSSYYTGKIKITVPQNSQDTIKTGNIMLIQKDSNKTLVINIIQAAFKVDYGIYLEKSSTDKNTYYTSSTKDFIDIPYTGASYTGLNIYPIQKTPKNPFYLTYNPKEVTYSTNVSWIELGTESNTLKSIVIKENTDSAERKGTIFVSFSLPDGSTKVIPIIITQNPTNPKFWIGYESYSEKTDFDLTFDRNAGTKELKVYSNYSWTINESTIPSWISISGVNIKKANSSGTYTLQISAELNDNDKERTGTIILTSGGITKNLKITQKIKSAYVKINGSDSDYVLSFYDNENVNSKSVTITSGVNWFIDSIPDWLTSDIYDGGKDGGNDVDTVVTFTYKDNNSSLLKNEGYISFSYYDEELNKIISLRKIKTVNNKIYDNRLASTETTTDITFDSLKTNTVKISYKHELSEDTSYTMYFGKTYSGSGDYIRTITTPIQFSPDKKCIIKSKSDFEHIYLCYSSLIEEFSSSTTTQHYFVCFGKIKSDKEYILSNQNVTRGTTTEKYDSSNGGYFYLMTDGTDDAAEEIKRYLNNISYRIVDKNSALLEDHYILINGNDEFELLGKDNESVTVNIESNVDFKINLSYNNNIKYLTDKGDTGTISEESLKTISFSKETKKITFTFPKNSSSGILTTKIYFYPDISSYTFSTNDLNYYTKIIVTQKYSKNISIKQNNSEISTLNINNDSNKSNNLIIIKTNIDKWSIYNDKLPGWLNLSCIESGYDNTDLNIICEKNLSTKTRNFELKFWGDSDESTLKTLKINQPGITITTTSDVVKDIYPVSGGDLVYDFGKQEISLYAMIVKTKTVNYNETIKSFDYSTLTNSDLTFEINNSDINYADILEDSTGKPYLALTENNTENYRSVEITVKGYGKTNSKTLTIYQCSKKKYVSVDYSNITVIPTIGKDSSDSLPIGASEIGIELKGTKTLKVYTDTGLDSTNTKDLINNNTLLIQSRKLFSSISLDDSNDNAINIFRKDSTGVYISRVIEDYSKDCLKYKANFVFSGFEYKDGVFKKVEKTLQSESFSIYQTKSNSKVSIDNSLITFNSDLVESIKLSSTYTGSEEGYTISKNTSSSSDDINNYISLDENITDSSKNPHLETYLDIVPNIINSNNRSYNSDKIYALKVIPTNSSNITDYRFIYFRIKRDLPFIESDTNITKNTSGYSGKVNYNIPNKLTLWKNNSNSSIPSSSLSLSNGIDYSQATVGVSLVESFMWNNTSIHWGKDSIVNRVIATDTKCLGISESIPVITPGSYAFIQYQYESNKSNFANYISTETLCSNTTNNIYIEIGRKKGDYATLFFRTNGKTELYTNPEYYKSILNYYESNYTDIRKKVGSLDYSSLTFTLNTDAGNNRPNGYSKDKVATLYCITEKNKVTLEVYLKYLE